MSEPRFPSFKALYSRSPIPGLDYDPEAGLCEDDYQFLSGTGQYSDELTDISTDEIPPAQVVRANRLFRGIA